MNVNNIIRPEAEDDGEHDEFHDRAINPEDELVDLLEARIASLNRQNEATNKNLEDVYRRLEMAHEAMELQQISAKENLFTKVRLVTGFLLGTVVFFVLINIFSPDIVERLVNSSFTLPGLILSLMLALVVLLIPKQRRSLDDTFLEIDRAFNRKAERADSVVSSKGNTVNVSVSNSSDAIKPIVGDKDELEDFPKQLLGASSDFEFCISEIVDYLGDHIKLAESKASKLLDKGTTYLRRGLYFYIGSIVVWQVWGHFVSFDSLVIAGMISTSIAFIIIEFLAAWFLKQYRSFVDSSMAYMRVQSFFNRYLLLYFAARDFGDDIDGDNQAKSELLKVMSLEIKWPELKDVNANDFNYMVEAMGSMHTSFEKMKSVFDKKAEKKK